MIDKCIKDNCTGCEACSSICPKQAIEMRCDKEGFRQPYVDYNKCTNCKMCVNMCPVLNFENNHETIDNRKTAYAFKTNDEKKRKNSSSGGVFLTLSSYFIEHNVHVYGACFNDKYELFHTEAKSVEDLYRLAGSKYLQSRILSVYQEIKQKLESGEKVAFFGMTCQVEGLLSFLKKRYDGLYCVDLICMGIPSPMVWQKYLDTFFRVEEIKRINFKDKTLGWHRFSFKVDNKDGSSFSNPGFDNYYMECMFKGFSLRKSCFNCVYKCESKRADITIADCWGCEEYISQLDDNKGLSMIICHSDRGSELLRILSNYGILKEFDYNNVLKFNSNYYKSATERPGRKAFYKLMNISPRIAFKIMGRNPNNTAYIRLKKYLKKILRR